MRGWWCGLMLALAIASPVSAADLVVEVRSGTATIDQDNGKTWPARTGTLLRIGDLLRPETGAVVVVRCDNGTMREARYVTGVGRLCPDSVRDRSSETGRGEDDFLAFLLGAFVYSTQVVEAEPPLQWEPVVGATGYRVQVAQGEQVLWDAQVATAQALYDGPPLVEGSAYQVIITATAEDEVLGRSRLLLRRLTPDQIQQLDAQVAALDAELQDVALSEEGRAIALAQLYLEVAEPLTEPPEGSGLVLAAIAVLEGAIAPGEASPFTHRLLGDLYLQVGRLSAAVGQYEQALELTESGEDELLRGAAWVGLANVAAARGVEDWARRHLECALVNYRARGATQRVAQVEGWLEKLP
ncbi:MAG: hypothetical protein AAF289_08155 [Cyanobacteria bacterium P01_A01_bin.135]